MAVTWTLQTTIKVPGLATLPTDAVQSITGDTEQVFEVDVLAGQTKEIDFGSIDRTKIQAFALHTSLVNTTANTNAADATGGNTFALKAGKAIEWDITSVFSSPITQNVTKLYFINTGAKTTTCRAGFLMNLGI